MTPSEYAARVEERERVLAVVRDVLAWRLSEDETMAEIEHVLSAPTGEPREPSDACIREALLASVEPSDFIAEPPGGVVSVGEDRTRLPPGGRWPEVGTPVDREAWLAKEWDTHDAILNRVFERMSPRRVKVGERVSVYQGDALRHGTIVVLLDPKDAP